MSSCSAKGAGPRTAYEELSVLHEGCSLVLKTCISQGGGSSLGTHSPSLIIPEEGLSSQVARPPSSRCDQVPGGPEKRQQAHDLKDQREGSSLVVQWLGLGAFTGVQSLAGELRSPKVMQSS